MEMSRRGFVRDAFGTAVALAGLSQTSLSVSAAETVDDYYPVLVKANEELVERLVNAGPGAGTRFSGARGIGENFEAMAAAFCAPESKFAKADALLAAMGSAADKLLALQHADGTIDSGNLCSPPDTAFVVQNVSTALTILRHAQAPQLAPPQLVSTIASLDKFLQAAGEALVTGGVHTPNHRWVVSSALAQLHALFPSPRYVARIDDWLGEGVYCDEDGQFEERATGIYSRVTDNAMITMARLLNRPHLLEPVRRNLAMTLYYMHPNGEVETVASRRQDQDMSESISNYYLQYRYMAAHDQNGQFAAAARFIESIGLNRAEVRIPLAEFLVEPMYRKTLPRSEALPDDYARVFSNSALARIRRGDRSATVYGGSDWPLGIASGLASNPTFFTFRKGRAVLESVRLLPVFFNEASFRSQGMQVEGNRYHLHQENRVPYYQPLPRQARNAKGDYPLTPAGKRFWAKMNFPERTQSNVQTLSQKVTVTENAGAFELAFDIGGHDGVPIAIELTFRQDGALDGVEAGSARKDLFFLRKGTGRFRAGDDVIEFGPGESAHEMIRVENQAPPVSAQPRVYITGVTPFVKTIRIS